MMHHWKYPISIVAMVVKFQVKNLSKCITGNMVVVTVWLLLFQVILKNRLLQSELQCKDLKEELSRVKNDCMELQGMKVRAAHAEKNS